MVSVLVRSVGNGYTTQVTTEHHAVIADEPQPYGDNLGPTPYDLLMASLGACTSMTLLMYARRKEWPLESVQIEVSHERMHAKDCEECETEDGRVEVIRRSIHLEGELSDEQRERLLEIARRCPVHQTLEGKPEILDSLV